VLAGLAGAVQVAMMSQLGDRISVLGAVAFASLLTAVVAVLMLVVAQRSVGALADAFHQPRWMLGGGLMGLVIVLTITYAGTRIGVAEIPLSWPRLLGIALLGVGAALSLKR
jgi:bacterial/archaeal transporter family-2 protein